ncbi:hypothetical protein Tco_0103683 [Tanacetum coccineum]
MVEMVVSGSISTRLYGIQGLLQYGFERGDGWCEFYRATKGSIYSILGMRRIVDVGGLVYRFDMLEGLVAATAVLGKSRGHVASFFAMERSKQLGELL